MTLLLLLACAGGPDGGDSGDSGGGDTGDTGGDSGGGFCDEAPVVTFETFGAGFLTENCQPCHASTVTGDQRYGAPAEVYFDAGDGTGRVDVAAAWSLADRILARATGDAADMPPLGGTTEDDRYRVEVWLTCADPGT